MINIRAKSRARFEEAIGSTGFDCNENFESFSVTDNNVKAVQFIQGYNWINCCQAPLF